MEEGNNEEVQGTSVQGKYTYTPITHPWLHDSSIALHRMKTSTIPPWQTDTLQLLEKEWIDWITALPKRCQILEDIANGRVPHLIDLTLQHLDEIEADAQQRQIYASVMSLVRRRWKEFSMLRTAILQYPDSLIVPYVADLETSIGEWMLKEPFWVPEWNALDGVPVLQRLAQAWAIVDLTKDGNENKQVAVKQWMKRTDLVWHEKQDDVGSGGRKRQ